MPVVEIADAVRVRVPAKVNLHLSVGSRPPGRLPRPHDRVPGGERVRRRRRPRRRRAACDSRRRLRARRPDRRREPRLAGRRAARRARRHVPPTSASNCTRRSRSPAAWPAGRPTPPATLRRVRRAVAHRHARVRNWPTLAGELGSDVAFPLTGGTALGTGRGEQLTPGARRPASTTGCSRSPTSASRPPTSYRELDRLRAAGAGSAIRSAPPTSCSTRCAPATADGSPTRSANDLQPAALSLRPELGDVLAAGAELGALGGIVSGSGPDLRVPLRARRRRAAISRPNSTGARVCARDPGRDRARARCAHHRLMANLVNLETVGKSYGTTTVLDGGVARHRRRRARSASSGATAAASRRCCG